MILDNEIRDRLLRSQYATREQPETRSTYWTPATEDVTSISDLTASLERLNFDFLTESPFSQDYWMPSAPEIVNELGNSSLTMTAEEIRFESTAPGYIVNNPNIYSSSISGRPISRNQNTLRIDDESKINISKNDDDKFTLDINGGYGNVRIILSEESIEKVVKSYRKIRPLNKKIHNSTLDLVKPVV